MTDPDEYFRQRLNGEWPDPTPLGANLPRPTFPVEMLPDWMRDHVVQVAEEFQFPPDLPAQLAITALSIITARRAEVVVQGTWREPLNTYLVTSMPPSAAKSPAFKAMLGWLDHWEAELIDRTAPERDRVETQRAILEKLKTKAINAGSTAEALALGDEIRELPDIPAPRLMADDATPEKLTEMLAEQDGRMALLSTEGGVFELMTGRYSDKSNLDVYLKAWSGDSIRVDRIGRKSSVVLHPALTIGLTVQPDVIAKLADHPELAGRGLTARPMYAFPKSNIGYRDMSKPPSIDEAVAGRYEHRMLELAEQLQAGDREDVIAFTPEALAAYSEWRQGMEDRCRPGGDLFDMQQWVTKLGSTTARLAGLLTVADGADAVDEPTAQRAITIGRYWEAHARIAYSMWITDATATLANALIDWIATEDCRRFTLRDAYRAMRAHTAEEVADALGELVDNGWLRVVDNRPLIVGKRGTPSPELETHPRFVTLSQQSWPHGRMSLKDQNSLTSSSSVDGDEDEDPGTSGHEGHDASRLPSVDNSPTADYEDPFA